MSALKRLLQFSSKRLLKLQTNNIHQSINKRLFSKEATNAAISYTTTEENEKHAKSFYQLAEYRFVYPEFLPNPNFKKRDKVREKLERQDMLKRRSVIDIPEFYVGSILAVTASDPYAPGKENKFVGICIKRTYHGLKATFTLRNVVDNQGVEIMYDMYCPNILSIEVLRLEKRLDEHLLYLRDAPLEYSTFPFDMEPEFRIAGEPVKVNPLIVKLKDPPWHQKWEIKNIKGAIFENVPYKRMIRVKYSQKPWESYDLMKQYRKCIPEEDQKEIWQDVDLHRKEHPVKQQLWKKTLFKAKPKQKQR